MKETYFTYEEWYREHWWLFDIDTIDEVLTFLRKEYIIYKRLQRPAVYEMIGEKSIGYRVLLNLLRKENN